MKSDRPSSAPSSSRLTKHEQPAFSREVDDDIVGRPGWLEPWLEAEEEIYSLPCTD